LEAAIRQLVRQFGCQLHQCEWAFRFSPLSGVYIGEGGAIMPATMTSNSDTLVLALAALGEATEIEMILIAKESKEGDIASQYHGRFHVQTSPM
jgi:hypothetical protein